MNRMLTRRAILATAPAGASVALAACGSATTTTPTAGTKKTGGTATFLASGDADRFQIRDNLLPRLLETTGVKGEWIHHSGAGYNEKLITMLASDTAPDLIYFAPNLFAQFVTENLLRNLTPLIKRDKYDHSDFPEKGISQYVWQGNQYGFPQDFPTRSIFYNVDMV